MEERLQAFIEAHPDGWGHAAWLTLLGELESEGFDVGDPEAVGRALEGERLAWELRRKDVSGLGPKRIEALVERFGTLWNMRHARAAEIAEIKTIHGKLADKIVEAMR